MSEPRMVRVYSTYHRHGEGGWPPDDAADCAAWFAERLAEVPEEHRASARIEVSSEMEYDCDRPVIEVSYHRPETEAERAEREADERRAAEQERREDLRELARLRTKYGDPR